MKSVTNLKQSKKLVELGIDLNIADMAYYRDYDGDYDLGIKLEDFDDNDIPAWSLAALEGLMPFQIIENNNRFGFYQVKGFNKHGETYRFGYKTNNDFILFETSWYNDAIDAAVEMVVWLKENNKL